jgi:vancomycin resistance protein YoaR
LSRGHKTLITVSVVLIVAAAAVICAITMFPQSVADIINDEKIHQGVTISGVDVGGMTKEEAYEALSGALSADPEASLLVVLEERSVSIGAGDVQASVDIRSAVDRAYKIGRTDKASPGNMEISACLPAGRSVMYQKISDAAQDFLAEKIDSSYELTENMLSVTVGRDGTYLDIDDLCEQVTARFFRKDYTAVTAQFVKDAAAQIDVYTIYREIKKEPRDAYYDVEAHEIVDSVEGIDLDVNAVLDKLENGTPGQKYFFEIYLVKPEITYDDVYNSLFENVLYEFTSDLVNIPNRTNNVRLAAAAINGTILMPGDEFDFNKIVGERTKEKGYKEATVYVGKDSVPEIGGGICQVASTIYVCTLYSNLKVTERWCHMYYVTYVPAGLDATIYWGSCNYRFINTRNYPIRIDTEQEGLKLTVRFRGTIEDDTYVEMVSETFDVDPFETITVVDETKPSDYKEETVSGYTGRKVRTTRNVYSGDGTLLSSTEEAFSVYRRRDKVITVGPPELPPSPPVEPTDPGMPPEPGQPPEPVEGDPDVDGAFGSP